MKKPYISFGKKYKGVHIEDIHDLNYLYFLINQKWFIDKFPLLIEPVNKQIEFMEEISKDENDGKQGYIVDINDSQNDVYGYIGSLGDGYY